MSGRIQIDMIFSDHINSVTNLNFIVENLTKEQVATAIAWFEERSKSVLDNEKPKDGKLYFEENMTRDGRWNGVKDE